MSWVKVDDKAWSHPKFAELSGNAVRLWLFALCWCNQQETDGAIPKGALRLLGGTAKDGAELVRAGLWHVTESGWCVHDFLTYQPSKAQRNAQREATAERVKRHREPRGNAIQNSSVTALHHKQERDCNTAPVPHPDPVPDPKEEVDPRPPGPPDDPTQSPLPPRTVVQLSLERRHIEAVAKSFEPKRDASAFPPDFEPSPDNRALAVRLGLDLEEEISGLRNNALGKGRISCAWHAELDTWLRRSAKFARDRPRKTQPQPDYATSTASELLTQLGASETLS